MKRILFLLLLLQVTLLASAYDIKVDGLCYNFTSDSTVAVTYLDINDNAEYVKGIIDIPSTIDYEGKKSHSHQQIRLLLLPILKISQTPDLHSHY